MSSFESSSGGSRSSRPARSYLGDDLFVRDSTSTERVLPLPALLRRDRVVCGTDTRDEERRVLRVVQVEAKPEHPGAVARRDGAEDLGGGASAAVGGHITSIPALRGDVVNEKYTKVPLVNTRLPCMRAVLGCPSLECNSGILDGTAGLPP
ncbi:hypothetical protein [Sorangium sp. So ce233]|uniref:hypothetical protein n=1 Tax=Sorangium sp. So ce233 TaxID=3133290 RepID=UPI003F5F9DF4